MESYQLNILDTLSILKKDGVVNIMYMNRDNKKEVMNALIMVFQFGINMIVPIFLCTLAGVWIGKKTGADWVTVPLFFLGAFAGANNIYRMVQKFLKPEDDGRAVRQTPGRQSTTETEISDSISRVEKDVKKNK